MRIKNGIHIIAILGFGIMTISVGCAKNLGPPPPTPTPTCTPFGCADFLLKGSAAHDVKFLGTRSQSAGGRNWTVYQYAFPLPYASIEATPVNSYTPLPTFTSVPNCTIFPCGGGCVCKATNTPVPYCTPDQCWLNPCECRSTNTPVFSPTATSKATVCYTTTPTTPGGTGVMICGTPTPDCTMCGQWSSWIPGWCDKTAICNLSPTNTPVPWCTPNQCNSTCDCIPTNTPKALETNTPLPSWTPTWSPTPVMLMMYQGYFYLTAEAIVGWLNNYGNLDESPILHLYNTSFPTWGDEDSTIYERGPDIMFSWCGNQPAISRPTPDPFAEPAVLCIQDYELREAGRFEDGDINYYRMGLSIQEGIDRPCKRTEDKMIEITGLNPTAYNALSAQTPAGIYIGCMQNTYTYTPTPASSVVPTDTPPPSVATCITPQFTVVINPTSVSYDPNFLSDTELLVNVGINTVSGPTPEPTLFEFKVVSAQDTNTLMLSAPPTDVQMDWTRSVLVFKPQATGSDTTGSLLNPVGLKYRIDINYGGCFLQSYTIEQDEINKARQEYKWFKEVGSYTGAVPARAIFKVVDPRLRVGSTAHYVNFYDDTITSIDNAVHAIYGSVQYSCSWRSPYVNIDPSIGSNFGSYHLFGRAVDCYPYGIGTTTAADWQREWGNLVALTTAALLERNNIEIRENVADAYNGWRAIPLGEPLYNLNPPESPGQQRRYNYIDTTGGNTIEQGYIRAFQLHMRN